MDWTMAQVIGHNVKTRREARKMTADALGKKIGEVFGKPWPRQTVYMMESGERAMVAQEVVALTHLLDMSLLQLFTPPGHVQAITAGTLRVPADALLAEATGDEHTKQLKHALRGLEQTRGKLLALVQEQNALLDDAKNALLGKATREPSQGDSTLNVDELVRYTDELRRRHQPEDANGKG